MNEYDEDIVGIVQERFLGSYFEGVILAPAIIKDKVRHGTKLYSEDYVRDLKLQILSLEQRIEDMEYQAREEATDWEEG